MLRHLLGRSDRWNLLVGWVLGRIRDWHALAAVELFELLMREVPASEVGTWEYGPNDSPWALPVLGTALDSKHRTNPLRRSGGERFVRLVIRIYADPTADVVTKSA